MTDDTELRPGIPREDAPMGARRELPTPQESDYEVLTAPERREYGQARVFGTSVPPRGFSGMLRRAAYAIPEHKAGHWMLLLVADRVDAWEHRPFAMLAVAAGVGGLVYWTRARRFS